MVGFDFNRSVQRSNQQSSTQLADASAQAQLLLLQQGRNTLLDQLYGPQNVSQTANNLGASLSDTGNQFLEQLSQLSAGQGGFQQQLQQLISGQDPGSQFLQQQIQEGNPFLDQQVDQLSAELNQQFQESLLPGIRRNAVSVGGLGGARQAIAEGQAAEGVSRAFASGVSGLQAQDLALRQQAAQTLAGNQLQAANLAGFAGGQQLAATQAGLGSLGGLFNLGLAPSQAEFAPLQAFRNAFGSPVLESQSQGSARGNSFGVGFQFGNIFGGA